MSLITEPCSIFDLCVGDANGDGKDCIYGICGNTEIIEYSYLGNSSWKLTRIDKLEDLGPNIVQTYLAIGVDTIRNLKPSLFVAAGAEFFEFYFESDHWEKNLILSESIGITDIQGGVARNDGIRRLYCSGLFGRMSELAYSGDSWIESDLIEMESLNALSKLVVGQGRGDGINRIYVDQWQGENFELTYKK